MADGPRLLLHQTLPRGASDEWVYELRSSNELLGGLVVSHSDARFVKGTGNVGGQWWEMQTRGYFWWQVDELRELGSQAVLGRLKGRYGGTLTFASGKTFVSSSGYGGGIPHGTLSDAQGNVLIVFDGAKEDVSVFVTESGKTLGELPALVVFGCFLQVMRYAGARRCPPIV